MAKNLVIVESPAKAKTIEGFLGADYIVKSSFGHVRDLPMKGLHVDIENGYLPTYEVSADKKDVIKELTQLATKADVVWLATDEDREGEAISWHLFEALGLEQAKVKRIVFHEITKPAIMKAIASPRGIDLNLVEAQQARRVLDRLVGFELSPILWKKIKPSLSAGRVQSVAVRLIVEREREIKQFKGSPFFKAKAIFELERDGEKVGLHAELPQKLEVLQDAQKFLEECRQAVFSISNLETKPASKSPSAPFTTSTLQQEASRKLGFSVAQTMMVAQRLYESGKITYMRTDSVNLSETAISSAAVEIGRLYGTEYIESRQYTTKSKGAQEAHEAIRPTYLQKKEVEGDRNEQRLYDLIWKRTIASQMSNAKLERTTATIDISTSEHHLVAKGEVIKFDGFLKVYHEGTDQEDEEEQSGMLPPLSVGQVLQLDQLTATQRFPLHPPRYTEASLVKKMEELGIGRPSTYAPTISTIQKREYVVKESREGEERKYTVLTLTNGEITQAEKTEMAGSEKAKMFPTDIGMVVNDFLLEHFGDILDYHFTAKIEKQFDEIAEGQKQWDRMIDEFYGPFHTDVSKTIEHSEKATGERILGKDPVSGKQVSVRIGRYGPMVQIGTADEEEKPKFASLRKEQRLEDITLEDALELFKLPRTVGSFEGHEIVANVGRFGPYVRHDGKFVSLKEDDPLSITGERAIEVILEKRKADKERVIKTFDQDAEVQILKGRWGPYLVQGKNNFKIPKEKVPEELTFEECMEIIANAPVKKTAKKAAPQKAAPKKSASKKAASKGKKK
ncbi:MAG: type I DNA topoisomerase [Flavobacteriales bacterium]|nr:type I DNA topoisomerase [Flavobacteriales bacterium]MCB9449441.1 type I DNA topoisomerase [Flavobacteriales bacterium]